MKLNTNIIKALQNKKVGHDFRSTGKSSTLMAYIATTQPTTAIGNGGAIIVAQTVREANWMRSMWHELFGAHIPMPKFMSVNQNFEGMSGVVFTDGVEPHLRERIPFRPHVLIDGGGVGR